MKLRGAALFTLECLWTSLSHYVEDDSIGKDKEVWVSFKYERLPNICYWCGCFNHDDKDCEVWLNSEGTLTPE